MFNSLFCIFPAPECDYDCFYTALSGVIPACDDEYQAVFGWQAHLDGDLTTISSTDMDMWYDILVSVQGGGEHHIERSHVAGARVKRLKLRYPGVIQNANLQRPESVAQNNIREK